jgi:hypothetical protein
MHHTFMWGRGSKPQCGVRGGEACTAESGGGGSRHRVAAVVEEETGVEATTEETGVERRRRECGGVLGLKRNDTEGELLFNTIYRLKNISSGS